MTSSIDRYREAERHLWMRSVGALPAEQYVQLPLLNTRVRLLEYGHGPTLLFIHGGPNAASKWLPLVRLLPNFRCLLLERPGCGLSELPAAPPRAVRPYMVQLIHDTLAVLDSEPAAIIASSFGSFAALAFAVTHPSRRPPMVHMGCPALIPGARIPLPFVLPLIPVLGALVRKLEPATLATSQRSFRRMGHPAVFAQRPDIAELLEWYTSLTRDTPTRTNDQALFARIRPRDALASAELAGLQMPMSFFWGEADTFGGATVARGLVEIIPDARLELVAQSGHLPWLDAPERAAAHVRSFLTA
jgi:pimeloyl-ACP methyl ester carboxylesterase